MSEETEGETFSASPELAEKIVRALQETSGDDVSGFSFGSLLPRIEVSGAPARPKDGASLGGRGDIGPIETGWTAWRLI